MKPLFTDEMIRTRLSELAPEIVADLGPQFLMVPILTGGFVFAADLSRALYAAGADPEVDFLHLASYGNARESSGNVTVVKDLAAPVEGLTVLIVDDVFDSGRSVDYAVRMMTERGAAKVRSCVAVSKERPRAVEIEADYKLFSSDGESFLVGYGMDDAGGRRGLPDISVIE